MKISAVIAMVVVGVDCIQKGFGFSPQTLLSVDAQWLWIVAGFLWLIGAWNMSWAKVYSE